MCFVGPNCPASVSASASASSLAFCSCSSLSFYCLSFYLHIYKWSTHPHTRTLILAPIHTLAKTHIKCVLRFWLAGNTFFSESSLGNILEKRSKKKSVFFTCVIWLSASLRPLHSYVFCHPFRKVTLYLLKRRKRYRALYKGTLEMPCWRSFYLTIAQLKLKAGRAGSKGCGYSIIELTAPVTSTNALTIH